MGPAHYHRPALRTLLERLREPRRFIQVLGGPRQVGKTTMMRQAAGVLSIPTHYASADDPGLRDLGWLRAQWEVGRQLALPRAPGAALLILDEIQKVPGWSDLVKLLWDEDTAAGRLLKAVVLGSAPLLMARGLSESLAGRFELLRIGHWTLPEMRDAFGWDLDTFVYFGGYPGAVPLTSDRTRWARYILDSLVETTIGRDILTLERVDKPALLRQLFRLGCDYSGQILPYQRMAQALTERGHVVTLAHYLDLLAQAGLVQGLPKFSGARVRQRGSSPKLLALNTALMSAHLATDLPATRADPSVWGRLVETAVGAHLVGTAAEDGIEVAYWRDGNAEVDFVLKFGPAVVGMEVTSGRRKDRLFGLTMFERRYPGARLLLVGGQGVSIADFLTRSARDWFQ